MQVFAQDFGSLSGYLKIFHEYVAIYNLSLSIRLQYPRTIPPAACPTADFSRECAETLPNYQNTGKLSALFCYPIFAT
ncbi:hypothetical protein [Undibacterium sp. KW1]|uniref:hypothetical protein n=1 Tax=Undibacterium sp. KW1 TaxID=2058624 RepID=UPI001389D81C|nr:hypothetical protein [Undibacterium sp. KW1]